MPRRARIAFFLSALTLTALTVGLLLPLHAAGPAAAGRTHTVTIEGMKFTPAELRAAPGDRVVFQNRDILPHTATAKQPETFNSGAINAGTSWTVQLGDEPQTIRYVCLFHPTMEGQIIVEHR